MKFSVEANICTFMVDTRIYEIEVICKAAYKFIEDIYVFFEHEDEHRIKVSLESKLLLEHNELERLGKEFVNELLIEKVRYKVSKQTQNIRELILGRALYSTCLEIENDIETGLSKTIEIEQEEIEDSIDDIAITWFEQYDKGEQDV